MGLPRECFVIMPYGTKPFPDGTGRTFDFEKVWRVLISRAIREAGMTPVRSDQRELAGVVHAEMFQDLRDRDVVVADLSLDNPNVFYELGVRHVMNAAGTVLICRKGATLPFDVQLSRVVFYDYDGASLDWEEVERTVKTLVAMLAEAATGRPDSPVHALLESVLPRNASAPERLSAGSPELAPDAEPCDAYQQLTAAAWQARGDTLEALFSTERRTVFGARALAHLAFATGLPGRETPEQDWSRLLANHLNDIQQYRLTNRLYAALQAENRLHRGSLLAYASSYSEEHDDIDGTAQAIKMVREVLADVEGTHGAADESLDAVVARAECHRRLGGLQQWYWQQTQQPEDLDAAIEAQAEAVECNARARKLGGLKHPGFLAQTRLKLLLLLRIRDGDVNRPDREQHREEVIALLPQPHDEPVGVSYLGWYQALVLADLGQTEAAVHKAQATLADDARRRAQDDSQEIGRRQYSLMRRFIEQYLPYLRQQGVVGQIAQMLQSGQA